MSPTLPIITSFKRYVDLDSNISSLEMMDLLESVHKRTRTLIKYNGIYNKNTND